MLSFEYGFLLQSKVVLKGQCQGFAHVRSHTRSHARVTSKNKTVG